MPNLVLNGVQYSYRDLLMIITENERLRADAERYRWIKNNCEGWRISKMLAAHHHDGKDLDATIDAARANAAK